MNLFANLAPFLFFRGQKCLKRCTEYRRSLRIHVYSSTNEVVANNVTFHRVWKTSSSVGQYNGTGTWSVLGFSACLRNIVRHRPRPCTTKDFRSICKYIALPRLRTDHLLVGFHIRMEAIKSREKAYVWDAEVREHGLQHERETVSLRRARGHFCHAVAVMLRQQINIPSLLISDAMDAMFKKMGRRNKSISFQQRFLQKSKQTKEKKADQRTR